MRILRLSLPLKIKKRASFRYFGFNPIESPCNSSDKHCSKFQKNVTVNKNNDNFEIESPLTLP